MPQINYRANLSAAIYPLSFAGAGRSVINPGPDNVYDRRVDPQGEQKNAGIPQAIYMENVVPTADGYQSIGLIARQNLGLGAANRFVVKAIRIDREIILIVYDNAAYTRAFISGASASLAWGYSPQWSAEVAPAVANTPYDPSVVNVRGINYVYLDASNILYRLDNMVGPPPVGVVFRELVDVSALVTGLTLSEIKLFVSSFNYLIAINKVTQEVHWSSTTTPLNFTPSLVTGAGSAVPNQLRGEVIAAHNCPDGFILYTTEGCIAAIYTGNSRYPFKFVEIQDAGKYTSPNQISAVPGASLHFAVDVHGTIRGIDSRGAQEVAPELSSWLRGARVTDSYDFTNNNVIQTTGTSPNNYKITYLLNRYVLVSIGPNSDEEFQYAFMYDAVLKRYGKLKLAHKDLWEYEDSIYFVSELGNCYKLTFDIEDTTAIFSAVLILGKFQFVRSRRLELQELVVEGSRNTFQDGGFKAVVLPSLEGTHFSDVVIPYDSTPIGESQYKKYLCRAEGQNISVAFMGPFNLHTVELTFSLGASR